MTDVFANPGPPLGGRPKVSDRRGCDPNPLDPTHHDDRMTLMASVWADQSDRFRLLMAALDLAPTVPVEVESANAGPWLDANLEPLPDGVVTVVFHSMVLQYLTDHERDQVVATLERAGAGATLARPLAWLRLESGDWRRTAPHEVSLTTWPGGGTRKLAEGGPHGRPVRWLAGRG
jgi:hypothetical protein